MSNDYMMNEHNKNIKIITDMFSSFNIETEYENRVDDGNSVKYCFSLKKPLPPKKILSFKDDLLIRFQYPKALDVLVEQTKVINRFEILLNNKVMENSFANETYMDMENFNFRNTLVIGNNNEERVNIIKRFVEKGYDCYVISDVLKNDSEIIAENRVFIPKDASALFQLLDAVMEKRYNNLATHNFKKIKDDIDNSSLADKSIIIIDSIDSLSPFAREIERYFIPLLQKGYAARICFVICVDRIINSYFIQAIVANCPNKIELQDAAVSLSSDDEDYYPFIEAVIHVVKKGEVSISLLQRWMALSYNRAKKYIDKMIGLGLVAYGEGDLRPKVIVTNEDEALDIIHKHAKGKKEIENT